MIKIVAFRFEELPSENHWVDFAKFGECTGFEIFGYPTWTGVNFHLNAGEDYQIGMDQSTTCSGVCIKNFRNTEFYMIECKRDSHEDSSEFMFMFEKFLHTICEGCSITHIIYEKPIKSAEFQSARVLFQLEGIVTQLGRRYPEFSTAKIANIENASWRSSVVLKEFNRHGRKEATAMSIRRIFPWADNYGYSLGKDQDVFESVGILFGWFISAFDPLGRPYVRGDRSKATIGGFIIPGLHAEDAAQMLREAGVSCKWAIENPKNSIAKNIGTALESYTAMCVEFSSKYAMLCLCIESNIKWIDPDFMTVILVEANSIPTKLKEMTGGTYHFVY